MKLRLLVVLLCLASSLAVRANGQTVAIQGSGGQASVFLDANGGSHITLIVTKGTDASGNPSTLLQFHIETLKPDGATTSVIGFGQVPNDAFASQNPSKMSLNVDTSQVTGFNNMTCIFTPSPNFGFTCSPSQGGPIQIAWTANGIDTNSSTDHRDTTSGPITVHMDGHGSASSADVQGSVVGFTFNSVGQAFASFISSGHTHTITITKN